MRPCLERGCPNLTTRTRCADHERIRNRTKRRGVLRLYDSAWARYSKERRAEQPWCSICGTSADLTVDHESDAVLCRPCHDRLEVKRRRGGGSDL